MKLIHIYLAVLRHFSYPRLQALKLPKVTLALLILLCVFSMSQAAQQEVLSQGVSVNTGAGELLTTTFTTAGVYNIVMKCPTGGVKVLYVVISDDADGDGMSDTWEWQRFGTVDRGADGDFDQDGLTDLKEFQSKTDPKKADTDGDGLPDGWEVLYGLKPLLNDANLDADLDGFKNIEEYRNGLNPRKVESFIGDEDEDGYPNIYEVRHNTRCDSAASIPAPTIIVSPDGEVVPGINTATKVIQHAINYVNDMPEGYDIVLVKAGTYGASSEVWDQGNRNIDFRGGRILVIAESGPSSTIINCAGRDRGFYFHIGETKQSVLSGFTITGGNTAEGAGIYCMEASPLIQNCVISGNTAGTGAGIYLLGSSPVIRNCLFTGNGATSSGGALFAGAHDYIHHRKGNIPVYWSIGSSPFVDRCVLRDNFAPEAAAIFLNDTYPHAYLAAVNHHTGTPKIAKCMITGNKSSNSSVVKAGQLVNATLVNCAVMRNHTRAVYNLTGNLTIRNCTISGNLFGGSYGAGVYAEHAGPYPGRTKIENTIVWGNEPQESQILAPINNRLCTVIYCDYDPSVYPYLSNYAVFGSGNITLDPKLTSDGHVEKNTPVRNRGTTANAPADDIDGDVRTGGVYIGADQYVDSDGDELPDWWEKNYGLNPLVSDGNSDTDNDGLSNRQEYSYGTDPQRGDTDNDGLPDKWEVENNFEPLVPTDAGEDTDSDGLTNLREYQSGTNPRNSDSDGDGWSDSDEVAFGTDPTQENLFVDCEGRPEGEVVPASKHITIPQGVRVVMVKVIVFSREYPEYTSSGSEFNDLVTYGINSPAGTFSGSYNVNSLDTPFRDAEALEGPSAWGGSCTVKEVVLDYSSLTQSGSSYLDLSGTAVNINDNVRGSGVMISYSVLKAEFVKMWETANEANQIFNPTPKDDPPAIPGNMLYVTESPADSLYHVTLAVDDKPSSLRSKLMHAVYDGGTKLSTGEAFFPAAGPANITFNHPLGSAAVVTDFEIRVGYDRNGNGKLDSDEIISPLEVKDAAGVAVGPPMIRGASDVRYSTASVAVDGEITLNPLAHAGPLLQIFRDGAVGGLPVDKRPTSSTVVGFNCFRGNYSEWLTHNCGASFSSSGDAQIPYYTWDRYTSLANLVGKCHQITTAGETLYTTSVKPIVVAHFSSLPVGSVATFPLAGGFFSVPHVNESPGWPFTAVEFDEPLVPNVFDDVNGSFARARIISHLARYTVEKKSLLSVDYLDVTQVNYVGVVEDLYDFNYEAGLVAGQPAIVQIGHANGSYGATRNAGNIYQDRIEFNVTIPDPF